jgi:hypothetical protein
MFVCRFGNYVCDGLSLGARIGIGIAISAGVILFVSAIAYLRRRRNQRYNLAYINNPNRGQAGGNYPQQSYQPAYAVPYTAAGGRQDQQSGYQPGYANGFGGYANQQSGTVSLFNSLTSLFLFPVWR